MRSWGLIGAALVLGIAAAWMAMVAGRKPEVDVVPVVIASADVPAGMPLEEQQLRVANWPKEQAPKEGFGALRDVVSRVPKGAIFKGEPIIEAKLASKETRGGLSAIITPGKRAITVKVNEVVAVAGFALPGSYVDVLVSSKDAAEQPFSLLVLERVKVLAAAQETAPSEVGKAKVVEAVTLELTPAESEKLDLARTVGSLSLVLRNDTDKNSAQSKGTFLRDLGVSQRHSMPNSTQPKTKAGNDYRQPAAELRPQSPVAVAPAAELRPQSTVAVAPAAELRPQSPVAVAPAIEGKMEETIVSSVPQAARPKVEVIRGNNRGEVQF